MIESSKENLLGRWKTNPEDAESLRVFGQVTLVFMENEELRYIIHSDKKDEIILLKYEVEDNYLITNQPSMPQEVKTRFYFLNPEELVLEYEETACHYVKMSKQQIWNEVAALGKQFLKHETTS